jgi:hypothetical protein
MAGRALRLAGYGRDDRLPPTETASVSQRSTRLSNLSTRHDQARRSPQEKLWKTTTSFGLADLPVAIRVLELALRHVESKEAEAKG